MFFTAYLGSDAGLPAWREAVARHARWLGLRARLEVRRLDECRSLALCRLEHEDAPGNGASVYETEGQIVASTLAFNGVVPPGDQNAATLTASTSPDEVRIAVPPASPQQVCYSRTPHGYVFADDLRFFPQLLAVDLDDRAVYALLRYGAIPSPLTLYQQVQRIPNGHEFRLSGSGRVDCTPMFRLTDLQHRDDETRSADRWVADTLDSVLGQVSPSPVLYFSGGVDSALLAARLIRLGRDDVRLVNYSFGTDDEESVLALHVASHFGLECHQIRHDPRKVGDLLARLGADYSFPFGDLSAIPTNLMVHEALPFVGESHTVLEGTGADGAYGLGTQYESWRRLYGIPRQLRRCVDVAYRGLRLWRYKSRLEQVGRVLSKSAQLPLGHALVARNALHRVAYTTPDHVQAELEQMVRANIETMSAGTNAADQLSWLDLVWVCAGKMAPKSFDPLRARGIRPLYPFLQPSMVAVGCALTWDEKSTAGQAKALLKRLLARDIPPEYVYRRKIGFTRPAHTTFAQASVQEYLQDVVLSRDNVVLDYCRTTVVRQLVDRSARGALGVGAYSFLWVLMFVSGWLGQISSGAERPSLAGIA